MVSAGFKDGFTIISLGGSPGPGGQLSSNLTIAYIHIPTNDNPYGLFAFKQSSLDVSVAEDTKPGYEYESIANLTVFRKRGKDRDVGVSRGEFFIISVEEFLII